MSSLTRENKSRHGYRLRVYTAAGRKSIWLGDVPEPTAISIQRHVDAIIESQTADLPLPRQTVQWLDRLPAGLRAKLQPILGATKTVGIAIDEYLHDHRDRMAASTLLDRERSLDVLRDALDHRPIDRVTMDDVTGVHAALTVGTSTRGKIAAAWKAFFAWCIDRRWIVDNPARALSTRIEVRQKHFVPVGIVQQLLDICTCPSMRVAIAMSRWGGIRVPSELRTLTWSDVDFERKRITIHDSKRDTTRTLPMFPELQHALEQHPRDVPLCDEIADLSHAAITLRLTNLMALAHVTPWPAPWHSMRATRETELIERFGVATAAHWIGNSAAVALKSYALVTDQHWSAATCATGQTTD